MKIEIKAKDEDGEAFDFSVVPIILITNMGDGKKEKRYKRPKLRDFKLSSNHWHYLARIHELGGEFYGDFPAVPKVHSELKSGHQSRSCTSCTFK